MEISELFFNPLKEWKFEIVSLVAFSVFLGILQFYFLNFGFENPGAIGYCYLKNFVNLSWDRSFVNLFVMWFGLLFVFIFTSRREKIRVWFNVFFILAISPVILSIFDIVFITAPTGIHAIGYSGISSIFLGYGFFTLAFFIFIAWKNDLLKRKIGQFQIFWIIAIALMLPAIAFTFFADPIEINLILTYGLIEGVYQTFLQAKINIFIHVVGYFMGLCIPMISRKLIPI